MAYLKPMTPERWAEKGCDPDGNPLKAAPKAAPEPKAAPKKKKLFKSKE
jgi:hypothetical protein